MVVWRERVAWVGWTLLLAFAISLFVGLFLSDLRGFQGNGSTLEGVAGELFSVTAAVLLRVYWPTVRAWSVRTSPWMIRHRAFTISVCAVGFSLPSWPVTRHPISAASAALVGGIFGWLVLRRESRMRQGSDECNA